MYSKELKKWFRLDARGNREGVDAQFSIEQERLAFPVRPEMGEMDDDTVYPRTDVKIVEKLRESKTRAALWDDLPTELGYLKMRENRL